MQYHVCYGPDTVHFVETTGSVSSGQPNQKTFTDETEAIACLLDLKPDFFKEWDREQVYIKGQRVKFGRCIFRALQETNIREDFAVPDLNVFPTAEIPTPMNRSAHWVMVCSPEAEANIQIASDQVTY